MEIASTVDFAQAARALSRGAGRLGLMAPGFRSPPRLVGCDRTIRRRGRGRVVAVRVKGRPRAAVLADMIEGVVVANGLVPPDADRVRTELWRIVEPVADVLAPTSRAAAVPGAAA
jgi:hypothetical protein